MVDALSRTFDDHASLSAISMPIPNWLQFVQQGYVNDSSLSQIIQNWPLILLLYCITLGMVLLYDIRVTWCFPRAQIFTRISFMKSMLLHQQGTLGSLRGMSEYDVTSFGRE